MRIHYPHTAHHIAHPLPSLAISVWFIKHALCGDIVTIVNPALDTYFQCCVAEAGILARAAVSVSTITIWRPSPGRHQSPAAGRSAWHSWVSWSHLLSLQSTHLAAERHIFTETITIHHCALLHSLYSLTHPNQCSRWRWKY